MSVCKVYQKSLSCRPILTTHVVISSDIYVHICVRAHVSTSAQLLRDEDNLLLKRCSRRSTSAQILRAFNDTHATCTYETRRATEAVGPRKSPVLVSDDQCVRSSSLNVRETLVAIKIRTLRSRSFAISRFNPLWHCRGRVDARARNETL